jgi:CheY-like chemotaxis protein
MTAVFPGALSSLSHLTMNTIYTILYIEDDQDDLLLIAEAFEKHTDHLRVVHSHNGYEGLNTLEKMKEDNSLPCLVIIDINMPVMDGNETLRQIRSEKEYNDLPVVMFSTSSNPSDKKLAAELDADFMTKPSSIKEMETLVSAFVNKCRINMPAH